MWSVEGQETVDHVVVQAVDYVCRSVWSKSSVGFYPLPPAPVMPLFLRSCDGFSAFPIGRLLLIRAFAPLRPLLIFPLLLPLLLALLALPSPAAAGT